MPPIVNNAVNANIVGAGLAPALFPPALLPSALLSPTLLSPTPISFQNISLAKSDTFSPNSLAWRPMKCRGYLLLATCQPAPGQWWNHFVEVIKIARIPPVVYTKSHHSSRDMLSLLTYRSYRTVIHQS